MKKYLYKARHTFRMLLLLLGCYSVAFSQTYVPLELSGFNADLIANGAGAVTATTTKGIENDASIGSNYYVAGYSTGAYGLPLNRIVNSATSAGVTYQLANYTGNNGLILITLNHTGTLTLLNPGVYDKLVVCAASSGNSLPSLFNARVNFSDNTGTTYTFTIPNWTSTSSSSSIAISGVDRVFRDGTFENTNANPKMYDCYINLNATDKLKIVNSITFTNMVSNAKSCVFALCGITSVGTPNAVVATAPTVPTKSTFTANWNVSASATSYVIDVSRGTDFSIMEGAYNNMNVGNVASFEVTTLNAGITFYYRVRAVNANGQGLNSNVITAYTIPNANTALASTNKTATSFDANWTTSIGATNYLIEVATSSTFAAPTIVAGYNKKDIGATTTTTVTGIDETIPYYYRIYAVNQGGQSAPSLIVTVKGSPAITFNNPATIIYGASLTATQLIASVVVSGSWVYLPATGTVLNTGANQTLRATFTPTDMANYNIVSKTAQITVIKANPVLSWSNPSDIYYETRLSGMQLSATATVSGVWDYLPASGTLLNTGNNQSLVGTFTPTDASNYNITSKTVQINVLKASPAITWNNPANIVYGASLGATQLSASTTVSGLMTYTPSSGTVLNAGASQTLTVTFAPTDVTNYHEVSKTAVITVEKQNPVITWNDALDIVYGTPINATQQNASTTISGTWDYVPVSGTILNAGASQTLTATFTPTDGANYHSVSKSVRINIVKDNPVLTWSNPSQIVYGEALSVSQLNASASVSGTWTYNPPIGTVLNAASNQMLTAEFLPTDASNYNTVSTTVQITVAKANPIVAWSNPSNIVYGTALDAIQLSATATISGTWSYNPASGTIMNAGNNQTLTAIFTPTDATNYTNATASVLLNVLRANPEIVWSNAADIVYEAKLSEVQLSASSTIAGTWMYSPAIETVLSVGANQQLTATLTPNDITNYNTVSKTVTINVVRKTPQTEWATPSDVVYGTLLNENQLNASSTISGTWAYTPASGTLLNAGANQVLSATFTPTDGANYNEVTKSVLLNVYRETPIINWDNPAEIVYNTVLSTTQLCATSTISGSWVYEPSIGTKMNAGSSQTISVRFTPTDELNYNSVSKSVQITVQKFIPIITWANPSTLVYGTALSATQLNATTTIDGTWTYSPTIGTVMNAGKNQILTTVFTPTDAANYTSASKTAMITIEKAEPVLTWDTPKFTISDIALNENQLNASANVLGTFVYTPSIGTLLPYKLAQTIQVEFLPTDSSNYTTMKKTVLLDVMKAAPTVQAEITDVTDNSGIKFTVNWTRGNGDYCKVFVSNATSGEPQPVFGKDYIENAAFQTGEQIDASGWYCVYSGEGTSVTVTGLSVATDYRVMVVEFNEFANTKNYLLTTNAKNPLNVRTMNIVEQNIIASNYISPNNDGKNDAWIVERVDELLEFDLFIFNNIGEELYHTKGYDNTWRATFKGKDLPSGTYYYIFKKDNRVVKGFITVVR